MIKKIDKGLNIISILYLIFPVIFFSIGWLKLPFNIIGIILCCIGGFHIYRTSQEIYDKKQGKITKTDIIFWIVSVIVIFIWIYLSGIGGFGYQNKDFRVRNPIYNDLCTLEWPVIYNIDGLKASLSYYFTYWLTPSFIVKTFNFNPDIILFVYSFIGVILAFRLFIKATGKKYISLILFIFFSGMDILGLYFQSLPLTLYSDMEWLTGGVILSQYTSMTSGLYWVFNQTIPLWIIMSIFLISHNEYTLAILGVLSFIYSPWTIFGILPLIIYKLYCKHKNIIKMVLSCIKPWLVIPVYLFIVFALFYTSGDKSSFSSGLTLIKFMSDNISGFSIFDIYTYQILYIFLYICIYVLFISSEFLLYWLIIKRGINKEHRSLDIECPLHKIIIPCLFIFPLIFIRDENFCMRASLPTLFIFMTYIIRFLSLNTEKKNNKYKVILIILLLIGMVTPIHEISRSIVSKINNANMVFNPIKSFSEIVVKDDNYDAYIQDICKNEPPDRSKPDYSYVIEEARGLYLSYDYKNSNFYKHIGKKDE